MKSQVNFSIDTEVLIELDKENVNKSALVEGFLREYLQLDDKEKVNPKELEKSIRKAKTRLNLLESKKKQQEKQQELEEKARLEEEAKRLDLGFKDFKYLPEGEDIVLFTKDRDLKCLGCREKVKIPFFICKTNRAIFCKTCEKKSEKSSSKLCSVLGACKEDHLKVIEIQ